MSKLAMVLRRFWLPGLHGAEGRPSGGLREWLGSGQYQIYDRVNKQGFVLSVQTPEELLVSFAVDCNRLGCAAIETIIQRPTTPRFVPKSKAWFLIKTYYSAFFAAQAILRLFGTAVLQIDSTQVSKIAIVANLYGCLDENPQSGQYYSQCSFRPSQNNISFKKNDMTKGGVHEMLWIAFLDQIRKMKDALGGSTDELLTHTFLDTLEKNLVYSNCGGNGNWLSRTRNDINYRQAHGVWLPFKNHESYHDSLENKIALWRTDPLSIAFRTQPGKELDRFMETCCAIVGMYRVLTKDMAERNPNIRRRSFLEYGSYGPVSLLRTIRSA